LRNYALTIESNKTLGGIGAILLVIFPFTGWAAGGFAGIVGLAGAILVLVALNGLANEYRERRIFNNALYGVILPIVGIVIAAVIFVVAAFGILSVLGFHVSNWADPSAVQNAFQNFDWTNITPNIGELVPYLGAALVALIILFLGVVFGAVFIRRSLNTLAAKTGTRLFATAGLLMLIGAILLIVAIGLLLLWISVILLAVAFFEMRTTQTLPQTAPPPPAQT
jgi:uncharacterized membrane protein